MNILEHLANINYLPLNLFGLDLSISQLAINMWFVCLVIMVTFYITGRSARLVPGRWQTFIELIVLFVRDNIASVLDEESARFFPFIFTIFVLILTSNLMGLIPGFLPPTGNINVTGTLAVIVFLAAHFLGVKRFGFLKYMKNMVPAGLPRALLIIIFPIEIVSQLARPFSLAVRLFANLLAGHIIPLVFISLIFMFKNYLIVPVPVIGNVILGLFEIFISFIQAFIFSFLAAIYLSSAIKPAH
jgi:F-type H+-transporting ATPase subunit a